MITKLTKRKVSSYVVPVKSSVQIEAEIEAEDILNEAYHQTNSIYRQVQEQLVEFRSLTKEYKKSFYQEESSRLQQLEKKITALEIVYAIKHQALKKIFENKQIKMDDILVKKSDEIEKILSVKKEEYQKDIIENLKYLREENEAFIFYQEQEKASLENKEQELFLTIQKIQDNYKLSEQELNNQLDYYKELKKLKQTRVFKVGIVILFLATINIVQLTFSQPQRLLETIFPLLIACATVYLLSITISEGKKEKNQHKLLQRNQFLIEQNLEIKEGIKYIEEDLKKLLNEKASLEKIDRSFGDNFQFLKIIQQDLKESEMKRKILESENAALRKHLISQK
ncbi:hypothetical protein [Carnobacterium funditum]|uniref:hypothetical protein n=1 Tax=Carnobacterium funditum TaxID=2752 RepID=UPI00055744B7|nr:hypothetical protein [Carnobacterium funditum]